MPTIIPEEPWFCYIGVYNDYTQAVMKLLLERTLKRPRMFCPR